MELGIGRGDKVACWEKRPAVAVRRLEEAVAEFRDLTSGGREAHHDGEARTSF